MKNNNWKSFAELTGIAAIVASLIFVGLELQQSREIAIADIYQQKTAILIDQLSFGTPPEMVYEARRKLRAGEVLSADDEYAIFVATAARVAYWENNHFQYQVGLMSEEQWDASRRSISLRAQDPAFLKAWEEEQYTVRESFADEVNQILRDAARK